MSFRSAIGPVLILLLALLVNAFYVQQAATGGDAVRAWFYDSEVNPHTGCDFFALYTAGRALMHGGDIYAGDPQHVIVPCCFAFRYLPLGAALGAPFALLAPRAAELAWLALLELLALLCALLTYRLVRGVAGAVLAAGWLAATPLYLELYMGQFNMLQAALLFLALVFVSRERPRAADAALCGAMLWKLTSWTAAPALIVRERWRPLLVSAVLAAGSLAAYHWLTGRTLDPFWRNFTPGELLRDEVYRGDLGPLMFARVLLGGSLPRYLVYLLPAVAISLALVAMAIGARAPLGDHLALWFAAYFFIYPTIWEHHYLMLMPPLVYLYSRSRSPVLWLALLLYALPTPYAMAGPAGARWTGLWPLAYHASKLSAALLVNLVALSQVIRGGRRYGKK